MCQFPVQDVEAGLDASAEKHNEGKKVTVLFTEPVPCWLGGEYASMIYSSHKCAFSDIAELGGNLVRHTFQMNCPSKISAHSLVGWPEIKVKAECGGGKKGRWKYSQGVVSDFIILQLVKNWFIIVLEEHEP